MDELRDAALSGDVAVVARVLKAGGNVDLNAVADSTTNATVLHLAAEQGHAAVTHYLVLSKADVHARRGDGQTPLHLAAKGGHTNVCRLLINGGARVMDEDAAGQTPLHMACMLLWPAVVKVLLLERADIGRPNAMGQTPMALVNSEIDEEEAVSRRQATFSAIREADKLLHEIEAANGLGDRSRTLAADGGHHMRRGPQRTMSQLADGAREKRRIGRSHSVDRDTSHVSQRSTSFDLPPDEQATASRGVNLVRLHQTMSDGRLPTGTMQQEEPSERRPPKNDLNVPWSMDDMKFGELAFNKLSKKQRMVLARLAERRITEFLGEDVVLDLLQVPNTGNKVRFYTREHLLPKHNYKGVFAVPLPIVMRQTAAPYVLDNGINVRVPFIVQQCLRFLNVDGLKQDGIFRRPGNSRRMTDLQTIFDGKPTRDVVLTEYNVHDVAGLLKRFIRELPEPIFSVRLQNLFFAAMDLTDVRRRINCLQLLVMIMPSFNRDLLQALLFFLNKVHQYADVSDGSKMTSKNLAVVFAPNMARHLDSLDKPVAAMDLQQEQTDSVFTQELVQTLIDYCHEIFAFQTTRVGDLPLSRKSTIYCTGGSRSRTLTNESTASTTPPSGSFMTSLRSPIGNSPLAARAFPDSPGGSEDIDDEAASDDDEGLDDEYDVDDDTEDVTYLASEGLPIALNTQFLQDPIGSSWPEIMANLETRTERKIRRITEHVHPPASHSSSTLPAVMAGGTGLTRGPRTLLQANGNPIAASLGSLPQTAPVAPSPLRVAAVSAPINIITVVRQVSQESMSDAEDDRTLRRASSPSELGVFFGPNLNEEIAKQFVRDFKKNHEFVFGDIRKKDAKKLVALDRIGKAEKTPDKKSKLSTSSPLVPQAPDATVLALLDELEKLDLEGLARRMKESKTGVAVKDRRRGFRLHRGVFTGREATDWLVASALSSDRVITRRQATMLGRELLEMGALAHVTETQGFKDDNALYRFATDVERTAKATAAIAASITKTY